MFNSAHKMPTDTLYDINTSAPETEKEENFLLLSELYKNPELTQRQISLKLNISLGKINYLIRQLVKKGTIKMHNFSANPGKLRKVKYILTQKGLEEKIRLTYHFLKRKETEYNRLKKEWEKIRIISNA